MSVYALLVGIGLAISGCSFNWRPRQPRVGSEVVRIDFFHFVF